MKELCLCLLNQYDFFCLGLCIWLRVSWLDQNKDSQEIGQVSIPEASKWSLSLTLSKELRTDGVKVEGFGSSLEIGPG